MTTMKRITRWIDDYTLWAYNAGTRYGVRRGR